MITSTPLTGLLVLLLCVPLVACAPAVRTHPDPAHVRAVFAAIDERNATVKRSEPWLAEAYAGIGIRDLREIVPADHGHYRPFAKNGEVYIIVHPGYFPFFETWDIPLPAAGGSAAYPVANLMDRIAAGFPDGRSIYHAAREQERVLRDFIEFMSEERRLVILILPRGHRENAVYRRMTALDEYARYINDLTNRSGNIVYLESAAADSGHLLDEDLPVLRSFLDAVGARSVLLGGGFLGKCLDGFFASLRTIVHYKDIALVPELTAVSPADMTAANAGLLNGSGYLDMPKRMEYFRTNAVSTTTGERLRWRPLTLYRVYGDR